MSMIETLTTLRHKVRDDGTTLVAAGVAFYAAIAVIPGTIIAVSIYGVFTNPDQAARHVDTLIEVLPETAARALEAQIHPIADFSHLHHPSITRSQYFRRWCRLDGRLAGSH